MIRPADRLEAIQEERQAKRRCLPAGILGTEGLVVLVGQGVAAVGGLVAVRVFTGLLPPATYGEVALALTAAGLAQGVLLAPLGQGFVRFFAPAQQAGDFASYLEAVKGLLVKATLLVMAAAAVLGAAIWFLGYGRWLGVLSMTAIFSVVSSCGSAIDGVQNAARQRTIVALHQGLGQWLRILCIAGFIEAIGRSCSVVMLGNWVAAGLVLVSQVAFFRHKVRSLWTAGAAAERLDPGRWAVPIRRYSWPFATWGLFTWVQASSDRWALQLFGSTKQVGVFSALYQLGYAPIFLLSNVVVQIVSPVLYSVAGDGSDERRLEAAHRLNTQVVWGCLALTVITSLVAYVLHGTVLALFAAPEYRADSVLLPWFVLAGGLFACGQVASLSFMSSTRSHRLILPKIGTAILAILLNFAGARWYGLHGVAWAVTASSMCYFLWILVGSAAERHRVE